MRQWQTLMSTRKLFVMRSVCRISPPKDFDAARKNFPRTFGKRRSTCRAEFFFIERSAEYGRLTAQSAVLDASTKFFGTITLLNADEKILNLPTLVIKNLSAAGNKWNRGFGRIKCTATINRREELHIKCAKNFFCNMFATMIRAWKFITSTALRGNYGKFHPVKFT